MENLKEIVVKNVSLMKDISNHPAILENILGILKNIETNIPKECRDQFYKNLELLRIVSNNHSECSLNAPIISLDEKLLWLADNKKVGDKVNFSDALVQELYHELLHLASTNYIVDLENKRIHGYSGFVLDLNDFNNSNNLFNGLTEGFTQYLTTLNTNSDYSNYNVQVACIKKLIDIVGIDIVNQCYYNNKLGMQPIMNKLSEKGMDINYIHELENLCHVDTITHLVDSQKDMDNKSQLL